MKTLPGLVDLQVNGILGADFAAPGLTAEAFRRACRDVLQRGTAVFCPTVITAPVKCLQRNLSLIADVIAEAEFQGHIPGIHLEGPFLSRQPGAIGAHNADWMLDPSIETFDRLQGWANGRIRILTLAAELPGADDLARHASGGGVCVCLGHQLADEDGLARLAAAGATALTHLGNGLPALLPRHHNTIWAGLANDDLTATFITDGHHLSDAMILTFLRTKGVDRSVVISDASAMSGLPPGTYKSLGITAVLEESGRLYNPQRGCLVGSSATMLTCMNYLAAQNLLDLQDLWKVGFTNPLKLIGLSRSDVDTTNVLGYDEDRRQFELLR